MRNRTRVPRPFVKWAGGKTHLIPELARRLPPNWLARDGRPLARPPIYHEPFAGGAAFFFHLQPPRAWLSDLNAELVNCFAVIRDHLPELMGHLRDHARRHGEAHYYEVRETDPAALDPPARAARTLYLNRTGYNGLYRVNSHGRFNVPFGRYRNPAICDAENLTGVSALLARGVQVRCEDFGAVAKRARAGQFVYFDPPYYPLSATAHFTQYARDGFGHADQERLAAVFHRLTEKGVYAMLSNSDHPAVRALYGGRGYLIETVEVPRFVNSNPAGRGKVKELLIRNYGGGGPLDG